MVMDPGFRFFSQRFWVKAASCATLVGVADFLFFGHETGWTLGLFALLLLCAIGLHNPRITDTRTGKALYFAGIGLAFALINAPGWLATLMFGLDVVMLAIHPGFPITDAPMAVRGVACYLSRNLLITRDIASLFQIRARRGRSGYVTGRMVKRWLVPIVLSAVFLWLFSEANPIITGMLSYIDWTAPLDFISIPRLMFWAIVAWGCWLLIRPRVRGRCKAPTSGTRHGSAGYQSSWLTFQSVTISLVLFNGLFLVQNALDLIFLWSGANLPNGVNYADYAHQGAYPLMVTALLAAGFVLAALKPGSHTESVPVVRRLVYAWVAQNIFLVFSAALRMVKYFEAYSLTQLRVTVLIWMALVALGLILIIVRIVTDRTNKWLINTNALMLAATLYASCFVNFPGLIAQYDVEHCREVAGTGPDLDANYLYFASGVSAIPAFYWFKDHKREQSGTDVVDAYLRNSKIKAVGDMRDWRKWNLREFLVAEDFGYDGKP